MTFALRQTLQQAATFAAVAFVMASTGVAAPSGPNGQVDGRTRSADGVEVAYTAGGSGRVALLFIHGGLADRTFWTAQMSGLSDRFRVVALDLGGHGESGKRATYTMASWAEDVRAVADALHLERIVLVGNSLGGPVALEAAHLLHGRVIGVVGVDTLHDLTQKVDAASASARAEAFRSDFAKACRAMVGALFHPDEELELHAWAEHRMCNPANRDLAVSMMQSFGGYDVARAARAAGVPIRAINGDLWRTDIEVNRTVVKDFNAKIMKGCGHYPMLERAAAFNRLLVETVTDIERGEGSRR
jgi:pimeloyl-ACP methyl ester carboxylesterase